MDNDAYVRYSQGDPRFPRFEISEKMPDFLVRQHFRIYTESPSTTVLERPVAEEMTVPTDYGAATEWTSGLYKVTQVQFRGEAIPAKKADVYWKVPKESDSENSNWSTLGTAHAGTLSTEVLERQPDGTYLLRFGKWDSVYALASFHGKRLILIISLAPDVKPTDILPSHDSNFVRIELMKNADLP